VEQTFSFKFMDNNLNKRLLSLLKGAKVHHIVDKDGVVRYSPQDEEVVGNELIGSLRNKVFPAWQLLSCPPDWIERYRCYMARHGIEFKEELINRQLCFLLPRKHRPHSWKLDRPAEAAIFRPRSVRYAPDLPFPAYSFVPGRFPHPCSDPAGHSFGRSAPSPSALSAEDWRTNRTYLYGIDLFNAAYYWESHVEFESLWLAHGRKGVAADFLKGLIKLAAAGVKQLEGIPAGVQSHACRAEELWRNVAEALGQDLLFGLSAAKLVNQANAICQDGWPNEAPVLMLALEETGRQARV
jgi:uncharacterized protein